MARRASEEFLRPYRDAVARHGAGFEATLWGSREAQHLRFDVAIDLVGFEDGTIVDAGCGPGDFAAALLERAVPFRAFLGVDAIEAVIEAARARGLERSTFVVRDLLADRDAFAGPGGAAPDWICFSGTLNTMDEASARALLARAFTAAAQGIVFNFLSDRHHPRWGRRVLEPARRFDTLAMLDWALARTSRVAFTQAYLDGHDATIVMWHDGAGGTRDRGNEESRAR